MGLKVVAIRDGGVTEQATQSREAVRGALILDAAFRAFTRYGFGRATMDDIAREAGISRPALYQHFRNKRDIYRAFAAHMTSGMTDGLARLLSVDGPPRDVLHAAFEEAMVAPMDAFAATGHGHELLDMKNELAADIMAGMRANEHAVLIAFFIRHGRDAARASAMADMMIDALEGAKARMRDMDEFRANLAAIIGLVAEWLEQS
jgi:AcrR family transcriptional regulator